MAHCKHRIMDKCRKNGQPCTFSEKCFEPEEQPTKTNADCLRAMSDEELEEQLVLEMEGAAPCKMFLAIPTGEMFLSRDAAREVVGKWLRQPAEEG